MLNNKRMKPEDLAYLKILRADCEKTLDLWCDKNSGKMQNKTILMLSKN